MVDLSGQRTWRMPIPLFSLRRHGERRQRASLRHEGKQVCSENDEITGELFTEQVSRGPSKKGLKE